MKTVLVALAATGLALVALPAQGQRSAPQSLGVFDNLEPGRWELRERGGDGTVRNICVNRGSRLVQLRHSGLRCHQVLVESDTEHTIVQYVCRGQGYGRTNIRRETNQLIQISTQGIENGLPFSYAAEGRRIGECRR